MLAINIVCLMEGGRQIRNASTVLIPYFGLGASAGLIVMFFLPRPGTPFS